MQKNTPMPFESWQLSRTGKKAVCSQHSGLPQGCGQWLLLIVLLMLAVSPEVEAQSPNQGLEVLVRRGQTALDAGNFDSAVADFEAARQLAPADLKVNRGLLLSYLRSNRLAEAEAVGRDAVAHWPQDVPLQHWLGLVYFKAGQNSQAVAILQRVQKLAPAQFDIQFDLALVLLAESRYSAAATALEKAVKLQPSHALAHILLGRAYQNSNHTLPVLEQFQTALRLYPNVPLGHYHLGFAYASLGRNQ